MELLKQSGLFGQGLIPVGQSSLVDRYNACLREIGLLPTGLKNFQVDGWGWSPEIAEERADPYYLSHGGVANPYAIILSPEQRELPIYFPFHSFDKHLMKVVFQVASAQIADLTLSSAIWIDLDQELSAYREPRDLLMVDAITLRFHASGGLIRHAAEQRELVHRFNNQRMAWADRNLLQDIATSVDKFGDLRFRSLFIPDIPYTNTRTFYTRAFDGLYVFRDLPGTKPMLVMCDAGRVRADHQPGQDHLEYALNDPALLPLLFSERLLDLEWSLYREQPAVLRRLRECLLMRSLSEQDPDADWLAMSEGELRRRTQMLSSGGLLPELFHEVDRLILQLQRQPGLSPENLSPELMLALTHPHRSLNETGWNTVRQMLISLSSYDIARLYDYDKALFFEQYTQWPPSFRSWAVAFLKREVLQQN